MSEDIKSIYVTVLGHVQGVGYRDFCAAEAERLGLTGWIRNRRDGSVEAIFHGREDRLHKMVDCCSEGPEQARVDRLLATPCNAPDVAGFVRRPDY